MRGKRRMATSLPLRRLCGGIAREYSASRAGFSGSERLVEEAAQEVFLKAFTQLGSFEGRGSLEGWLTRIATNTCLNMVRSSKRRPEFTVSDLTEDEEGWLEQQSASDGFEQPSVENSVVAADLADRLLGVLPPEDQQALLMIDGEDASIKEVAEATGWSESKVKVRAFRARRKLREAMEKLLNHKGKKVDSLAE